MREGAGVIVPGRLEHGSGLGGPMFCFAWTERVASATWRYEPVETKAREETPRRER